MKRLFNLIIILGISIGFYSCEDLDLDPMSSLSTGNWYQTVDQIEKGVNLGYRMEGYYWDDTQYFTDLDDNQTWRESVGFYKGGTMTSEEGWTGMWWDRFYQGISRMNNVLAAAEALLENGDTSEKLPRLIGEIHFFRAFFYHKLVFHWGDVPFVKENLTVEQAMAMGRTPKSELIPFIYDEFDKAASALPIQVATSRVTKGAALALKARFALLMGDYATAEMTAKQVMDLNVYSLYPDYEELFLGSTTGSEEHIFYLPRAVDFDSHSYNFLQSVLIRNQTGWCALYPTWDLFASYTCTDGLPVDESPLFNPRDPWKNRDPRLTATMVEPGTRFLGYIFQPHPDSVTCYSYYTNSMVPNQDCRTVKTYASFTGLAWKKGIDDSWIDNGWRTTNDHIISRYADVLLIYAEARIEQNKIDQSTLDAINMVRARAYGVTKGQTDQYPAVTETNQSKLRVILRNERRVEFALERSYRHEDLVRWKYCEIVFNQKHLIFPWDVSEIDRDAWWWPIAPNINDETGLPDFSNLEATGKFDVIATYKWNDKCYLYPIPSTEIIINSNMKQNPGY
jgi:hypothetical protein